LLHLPVSFLLFLRGTEPMLTVSLHGIKLTAPYGLYEEEHVLENHFEVDADIRMQHVSGYNWPFIDYTRINDIVIAVFNHKAPLLEDFTQTIHAALKQQFPMADKVKVTVRKKNPPMPGEVQYAQVCFED